MAKIKEIIDQNPWWKHGEKFVQFDLSFQKAGPIFFERKEIELKSGNIYIIRGPRQVGKTTYLKEIIRKLIQKGVSPNHILYLSLDFFVSRREIRNAIDYFLEATMDAPQIYIFLDEITSINDWNIELKRIADLGILKRAAIVATGSSAISLKEKGELLPGRGLEGNEYFLKPLCFREFILQVINWIGEKIAGNAEFSESLKNLREKLVEQVVALTDVKNLFQQIQEIISFKEELNYLFNIYFTTGGFPVVINNYLTNRFENKIERIDSILSEIFIRDILGDLSKVQRQEIIIRQLFKTIIENYGTRFSFSSMAREVGRSHTTIIDYLEYMEESFLSLVLYALDINKLSPMLKGDKKVYFLDPMTLYSVISFIKGVELWDTVSEILADEEKFSKIIEGIIIAHLVLHKEIPYLHPAKTFLWYYYDKRGREIDIIFKDKEHLGIEIKYKNQVDMRDINRIPLIKNYLILSKNDVDKRDNITILPVEIFLSLLPVSERNL